MGKRVSAASTDGPVTILERPLSNQNADLLLKLDAALGEIMGHRVFSKIMSETPLGITQGGREAGHRDGNAHADNENLSNECSRSFPQKPSFLKVLPMSLSWGLAELRGCCYPEPWRCRGDPEGREPGASI